MSEIDVMKSLESNFDKLDELARKRVLDWAWARYVAVPTPSAQSSAPVGTSAKAREPAEHSARSKLPKKGKKAKVTLKQIKDLNLSPKGKQSGRAFADAKAPTNVKEKCVVAIYYLRDVVNLPAITADHVFTFFKNANWPTPTDLLNTMQQAGTAGWLDTANAQDLKITPIGENLIEHKLPKSAKQ